MEQDKTVPTLSKSSVMCRMFFWCGIILLDSRLKEYGGFNILLLVKYLVGNYLT
jgi:hypothetical protein